MSAERIDGTRPGCCAAFSVPLSVIAAMERGESVSGGGGISYADAGGGGDGADEGLVLVAEIRREAAKGDLAALADAVRKSVVSEHGEHKAEGCVIVFSSLLHYSGM